MGDSDGTKTEKPGDKPTESSGEKPKIEDEKLVAGTPEGSKDADKGDSNTVTVEMQKSNATDDAEVSKEIKGNTEENKTETIMSSQSLKSSNPSISIPHEHATAPSKSFSLKNVKEKNLNRNQSDILPSLREIPREEDPSLMIFSSKGLPTKKYFRRREVNSTILPFGFNEKQEGRKPTSPRTRAEAELTPKISQRLPERAKQEYDTKKTPFSDRNPNVPNPSVSRNVLTGSGVSSQYEFKSRSMRRKDGNPVLGEGYEEPVVVSTIGRVPPGGFSSGLW